MTSNVQEKKKRTLDDAENALTTLRKYIETNEAPEESIDLVLWLSRTLRAHHLSMLSKQSTIIATFFKPNGKISRSTTSKKT